MENKKHILNLIFLNILKTSIFILGIAVTPLFAEKKLIIFTNNAREVIDIQSETNGNIQGVKVTGEKVFYKKEEIKSVTTYFDYYDIFRRAIVLKEKQYIKGIVVSQNLKFITIEDENSKKIVNLPGEQIKDVENYKSFENEFNKTKLKALQLSLIFPGVGQYYSGNKWKAYTIWFLTFAGAVYTIDNYVASNKAYADYNNLYIPLDRRYSDSTDAVHRANNGAIFLAGLYLFSIGDAYFSFKNTYKDYKEFDPNVLPTKELKQEIGISKKVKFKK